MASVVKYKSAEIKEDIELAELVRDIGIKKITDQMGYSYAYVHGVISGRRIATLEFYNKLSALVSANLKSK